ncbi:unnamed protein product [Linum trigynum]|uniref:DUF7148 domain-containing protein n=1 Tax=Linum trigynum TaxID=586398 RepID=A0AAV2CVH7_9ROSI
MASCALRQLIYPTTTSNVKLTPPLRTQSPLSITVTNNKRSFGVSRIHSLHNRTAVVKSSKGNGGIVASDDDGEDGVLLGTFKLPGNTDLDRFELLLFQWGNSLSQGANLPFPVPLKVDKVAGGARLGFITIEDGGETDVAVYIDCLVFPATESSGPIFRAIRNGRRKNETPPGEPRIMRNLIEALQKSIQIARL